MKKYAFLVLCSALLFTSCGQQTQPAEQHNSIEVASIPNNSKDWAGIFETLDHSKFLEIGQTVAVDIEGSSDGISAQQTGVGTCIVPALQPVYSPSNNRIYASAVYRCSSRGIVRGDIILNLIKSPSTISASKTIPFTATPASGLLPKTIRTDAKCTSGLYKTQTLVYATNMGTVPRQSSITEEYDIYCKRVNQFIHSVNSVSKGIADHAWNGTSGGSGHANDFKGVGINSQAQLEDYLRSAIINRHASSRFDVIDTCPNGRIALYDGSKQVFIIYNPIVPYYGSAYPASRASFRC